MLNGRGYPDTVNPRSARPAPPENGGKPSQTVSSPDHGHARAADPAADLEPERRPRFYTLALVGIPMQVVGQDARLLRGTDAAHEPLLHDQLGDPRRRRAVDVILDTAGVAPGTYFLYTTNLNHLSNDARGFRRHDDRDP